MCCETIGRVIIEHVGRMVGVSHSLINDFELKP